MPIFTTEQHTTLVAAIATGTKTVKYSDKLVTYQSLDEMLKIKGLMEKDLGIGEYANKGTRRRLAQHSKGIK